MTTSDCIMLGCDKPGLAPLDLCAFHSAAVEVDGRTYADGHAPTVTVIEGNDERGA